MRENYRMPLSWDDMRMAELYAKRDAMFHEIGLMLEDCQLMHEIGKKTFIEFEMDVLRPLLQYFIPREPQEVWKYRGVKISLIRYFCDTFNAKVEE